MILVFWSLVFLIAFAFVLFPLTIAALGLVMRRHYRSDDVEPSVTFLIAVYNESACIREKLANTLGLDYPPDQIEVVVVDDASSDGTADIVETVDDARVHFIRQPTRGGKIACINRAIETCRGDIVVLTDANAMFSRDALRALVRPFADPQVGGVCGNQLNKQGRSGSARWEWMYWELDKLLKRMECLTGSIVSADGSIYAVRREHLAPVPVGVPDDFYISTGVVASRGARLVFAPKAHSIEDLPERGKHHFERRVRIIQQACLALFLRRALLNPFHTGVYAYVLFGHKVLRRIGLPLVLLVYPATLPLWREGGFYRLSFLLQTGIYLLALAGLVFQRWGGGRLVFISAPCSFCTNAVAIVTGVIQSIRGRRASTWEPIR